MRTLTIVAFILTALILTACGDQVVEHTTIGFPGPQGTPGINGAPGAPGYGSIIEQAPAPVSACPDGGVTIVTAIDADYSFTITADDYNVYSTNVCNGAPGRVAPASPLTPVEVIQPCGPGSAQYKEVILRLADGSLLSSFSDNAAGQNTRLALLPDGDYVDTDGSSCSFSVSTNGSTRSISWAGGSESWGL